MAEIPQREQANCIHVHIMNREAHIAVINLSFYRNVFLLTQIVPPSIDFQQHFKKGMFGKPNTVGFLHVSHYLSTIYDAKLFKQMVNWPILCKEDEAVYRIEMKNFLSLIAKRNPDLKFPSILMSHLIQSGGTKFQIIMWKLSQLTLRGYIKREFQGELLNAPCTNSMQDLAIMHLNNIIAEKCKVMIATYKMTKNILDATNNSLNKDIEVLNIYKTEIFDRKINIKKLVLDLPAEPLIQKQLMNIEDSNIINLWKRNIFKKVQYIYKKNKELNELKESLNHLSKLVLRISSNPKTLDAHRLFEICCDNYLLRTSSKMQNLIHNLHANDYLVFSTLLSLLYSTLSQIYHGGITNLSDISQCLPFIENTCIKMKSLRALFIVLNIRLNNIYKNKQYAMSQKMKNVEVDFNENNLSFHNVLLQSPKINFNFCQNIDDNLFYAKLRPSPIEGKHKHLFRYKREYYPLHELPTTTLDFSNSWRNMSGWLSPRAYSINRKQIPFKDETLSSLYSRLLHYPKLNLKYSKAYTFNSDMRFEGLNLTPRKRPL